MKSREVLGIYFIFVLIFCHICTQYVIPEGLLCSVLVLSGAYLKALSIVSKDPRSTPEAPQGVSPAREVLPLRELILEIKDILQIPEAKLLIRCTLFEDDKGAEELAKVPKNRPRTKHIATKYHHFRESVKNGTLLVKRVETPHQLADIFTKALPKQSLEKPAVYNQYLTQGKSRTDGFDVSKSVRRVGLHCWEFEG